MNELQQFLGFAREKMEMMAVKSIEDGLDRPLIVALDLRRDIARSIAEGRAGKVAVASQIAKAEANTMIPMLVFSVEHQPAVEFFGDLTPTASEFLEAPIPASHYRFVAIAVKGVRWAISPIPGAKDESNS